jgi:molecular chaperone GrpE
VAAARDFAISRFAKDLLDSVDNLDRALSTVPAAKLAAARDENPDLANLVDGLKMTEEILMAALKRHGLDRFDPSEAGERFDPTMHEAAFMAPVEGKEDGTAFSTVQKGFKLNGRVIRVSFPEAVMLTAIHADGCVGCQGWCGEEFMMRIGLVFDRDIHALGPVGL